MNKGPDGYDDILDFNRELATEVRRFLATLTEPDNLIAFVNDRVRFIHEAGLSGEAEALLLDTNYQRIQAVMSAASSPTRWIVIWIV